MVPAELGLKRPCLPQLVEADEEEDRKPSSWRLSKELADKLLEKALGPEHREKINSVGKGGNVVCASYLPTLLPIRSRVLSSSRKHGLDEFNRLTGEIQELCERRSAALSLLTRMANEADNLEKQIEKTRLRREECLLETFAIPRSLPINFTSFLKGFAQAAENMVAECKLTGDSSSLTEETSSPGMCMGGERTETPLFGSAFVDAETMEADGTQVDMPGLVAENAVMADGEHLLVGSNNSGVSIDDHELFESSFVSTLLVDAKRLRAHKSPAFLDVSMGADDIDSSAVGDSSPMDSSLLRTKRARAFCREFAGSPLGSALMAVKREHAHTDPFGFASEKVFEPSPVGASLLTVKRSRARSRRCLLHVEVAHTRHGGACSALSC